MLFLKRLGHLLLDLSVPLVAIGVCVASYRLGAMALLERLAGSNEPLVTALRRIGVVASLFLAYWAVARFYERRRMNELAPRPLGIIVSAVSGALMVGSTIAVLFALGNYEMLSHRGLSAALPVMGTIVLAVVFEEALFRGVLFRVLERHAGTVKALVAQALLFGVLHLFNESTTPMTMVSVTVIGVFWTLVYVAWRNLWVVVAHHAAWNCTIFLSGVPLSGQEQWRRSAPLESAQQGPGWLTGGGFGPEDSILNVLLMTCSVAALGYWTWRHRMPVPGIWRPNGSRAAR